jgi:hypothetical protein
MKKDKYHNCFKPFVPMVKSDKKKNKHKKKNKIQNKTSQEKLQDVITMLRFFGWDEENIQNLARDWFELEDEK